MADSDFVDLMTGKIDGQQAFVQGKLKMQGADPFNLLSLRPRNRIAHDIYSPPTGNMALAMKLSVLRQQAKAKL